jgi:NTE family protein
MNLGLLARAAIAALGLALGGCATSVFNTATNAPMAKDTPPGMGAPLDIMGENAIALSFSGGGLRASAFAHGVLKALEETKTPTGDLLDDLTFISSVSGGSLTAAHYGLYGREGLAHFRENVLLRDFERDMHLSVLLPANLMRLLGGGLNDRANFVDTLDRHVFHGATFADIYRQRKPDIRIHATDLYNRIAFPFIPRVFSILCSDIRSYSVADAVGASMAVPLVFAPVVVRTYPDHCVEPLPALLAKIRADPDSPRLLKAMEHGMSSYRDPARVRFVKLVDGSVTDNFGLSTLVISRAILETPYAPMTERDAATIRRLLFIVVDASRGPSGDWAMQEEGPRGVELALHATDAATDASARLAADVFRPHDRRLAGFGDPVPLRPHTR